MTLVGMVFALPLAAHADASTAKSEAKAKLIAQRWKVEHQLQHLAVIDRQVMIRMRDGKRMAADIYRPKYAKGRVPVILWRTPYNTNYWDVTLGAPADFQKLALPAIKHGYAFAVVTERGHYFSEGNYDILGAPTTDGSDEVHWLATRPWSNGKVGTMGCSSSAEWQLAVVARDDPGLATFNVQGFGAGVGHVGPYYEQGNWFRGGAVRMAFIEWLYYEQNTLRPMFSHDMSRADRVRAAKMYDLEPHLPAVKWDKALWHLPVRDIIRHAGGPAGIFSHAMPVPDGGDMIDRTPSDPAWRQGGLWHQSMPITKPGLWFMSWYDYSISPNLAAYNYVRDHAPKAVADKQYAVIAPDLHCAYGMEKKDTKVGQLDVGDARFDYDQLIYGWFDHFLKGEHNGILQRQPKVMYYLLGANTWKHADTWPPAGVVKQTFYLHSAGQANTLRGDGSLQAKPAVGDSPDRFTYDPAHPVLTHGGCCIGDLRHAGPMDQTPFETRQDVLVYQTQPFKHGMVATGPVSMTLYVSSSARDTDFTFKVIDVYPDGKAYDLVDNIQRMRWREGYNRPPVWMHPHQVYKVRFQPIDIGNAFLPGHRLRVEVSSSDFPRFDRNLNTGGNNEADKHWVKAHNAVHHGGVYPSQITFTVMPGAAHG
ncbi:CocE/NonD family hydrolase [Oleiagrimonas sp. C23AA]|nr:CocE/NonD family hydrolase [Oleiagrimonas sp. C23AA]